MPPADRWPWKGIPENPLVPFSPKSVDCGAKRYPKGPRGISAAYFIAIAGGRIVSTHAESNFDLDVNSIMIAR